MPRAEYKVQTAALMAAECYTKKNLRGKLYKISSFFVCFAIIKRNGKCATAPHFNAKCYTQKVWETF